jgi:hypothetical protein
VPPLQSLLLLHWTHVWFAGLQTCSAPQSVSIRHSTQIPVVGSQTGRPPAQLALVTHSTQVLEPVLQTGVDPPQSPSVVHWTHVWVPVSQTKPGSHSLELRHCTHVFVDVSHTSSPQ